MLDRRIEQLGAFDLDVLTVVIDGFAFQYPTPDAGELHRRLVALFMTEEQAVTRELFRITTGDQIEQRPASGQTIQGCRLPCRHGRRDDARTQRDQKFQTLSHRYQRRRDQPGVLAGTPGRNQHAAKAQAVGSLGNLLQVTVIDCSRTFGGAQVVAVAMGGKKPENVEAHWSCLLRGTQAGTASRHGRIVKAR
ncbi:hypothetical protein D3C77_515560 [compost metagenome]